MKSAPVILLLVALSMSQELSKMHSMIPPFSEFNWSGYRKISGWECGGDAMIKEHFIRLTPDRQSKSGYCWSSSALGNIKWATTVTFRISGQGENMFGDGLSVFFVQDGSHKTGKLHGTDDHFVGFAVTLSTFKNPQFSRWQRDIALYVGNKTTEGAYLQQELKPGCYANYRFHEKRQDFSVDSKAVLRISFNGETNVITAEIDEKGSGLFRQCFSEVSGLPPYWYNNAHIGISSSTGQLADNHDLLSVSTVLGTSEFPAEPVREEVDAEETKRTVNGVLAEMGVKREELSKNELVVLEIMEALDSKEDDSLLKLKKELEHSLTAVDDSLNNMIKKLQQRGDVSENRISELEVSLKQQMQSSLSKQIEVRIKALERLFEENLKEEVQKKSKNWILPFLLLVGVLGAVFGFIYKKYIYLQKTHML